MVIQRIYGNPSSAKALPSTVLPSTIRKRSETLEGADGNGSVRSTSPFELNGTRQAATMSKVAALRSQHTGSSEFGEQGTNRTDSPSPYEGIRAPSTVSVLKPSDFAKRKSMFMQQSAPQEPVKQFHAKLERHYSGLSKKSADGSEADATPPDPKATISRGRAVSDGLSNLLIPFQKTQTLAESPISTTPLSTTATSVTPTSAAASPKEPAAGTRLSSTPRVEHQVIQLTERLRETASENKQLVSSISDMEIAVEKLKDQHREAQGVAAEVSQTLEEETVPKAKFDELKADMEKGQKDLEQLTAKTQEGERLLRELRDRAGAVKLNPTLKGTESPHRVELDTREALEQAVERLKGQVEVATSVAKERRVSLSSQTSERTAPSATRIPLSRTRKTAASSNTSMVDIPASKNTEPMSPPLSPPLSPPPIPTASSARSRRAQVVSFCAAPSLPERTDLERQITQFYEEAKKPNATTSRTPTTSTAKPEEKIEDVLALMDGITEDGFNVNALSLDFPKSPTSTISRRDSARDSASMRSSVRSSKKKGWGSLFKVRLPGSVPEGKASRGSDKPPTLAPIAQPSPITL